MRYPDTDPYGILSDQERVDRLNAITIGRFYEMKRREDVIIFDDRDETNKERLCSLKK